MKLWVFFEQYWQPNLCSVCLSPANIGVIWRNINWLNFFESEQSDEKGNQRNSPQEKLFSFQNLEDFIRMEELRLRQ